MPACMPKLTLQCPPIIYSPFSNEALRLLPPVLGGLQRQVDYGSGGVTLGGQWVV